MLNEALDQIAIVVCQEIMLLTEVISIFAILLSRYEMRRNPLADITFIFKRCAWASNIINQLLKINRNVPLLLRLYQGDKPAHIII